jgi:phosphate uptake regulator
MTQHDDPIERKVQLTGGSTYTVSLPKKWAGGQGIEAGSVVQLHALGDQLLIAPTDRATESNRVVMESRNRDSTDLARSVVAAYVTGCEEIRVEGIPDREQRRSIRDTVSGLVGIEVYAESDEAISARTMLDVDDLSAEQMLVQMELITLSMHETAIEALLANDNETARQILRQDDEVDRLFRLICREFQRSLSAVSQSTHVVTFEQYTAARQIERVADHAEKISEVTERAEAIPPEQLGEELEKLANQARRIVRRARYGLLDGDTPEELGATIVDAETIVEEVETLDRELYESDYDEAYLLGTVLDSITRTAEYGVNIAEAGLQATMRETDTQSAENSIEHSPDSLY